jgi:transketolase
MIENVASLATAIRAHSLRMTHRAHASHIGSCLSMADVLAVLYGRVLRIDPAKTDWDDRDRFVLSKGHGAAALYSALAESGFFPIDWLDRYCEDGSPLVGHVTRHGVPGVELSTGSLGHGLPVACGMALHAKRLFATHRVFVLLSDGELDEGSNWEAVLFAPHHELDNLVVIIDSNKIQSFGRVDEVLPLEPIADKWRAFGWAVTEVDGHDIDQLEEVLTSLPLEGGRPSAIIADTVKGKGVSFMEDRLEWHYKSPDDDQLARALLEIGAEP